MKKGSRIFKSQTIKKQLNFSKLDTRSVYGLVLCGGKSSRMGEDKSFLTYHGKAQCYHVYDMLQPVCAGVFISCNAAQSSLINKKYNTLGDLKKYADRGPATGVLTAFDSHPLKDFLVIGCDYPLLSEKEIRHFLESIPGGAIAAAFYDEQDKCYQPVIAWYSSEAGSALIRSAQTLTRFLEQVNAYRHLPLDAASMRSVDTMEAREQVLQLSNKNH